MTITRPAFDEANDDIDLSTLARKFRHFFAVNGKLIWVATLVGLVCGLIIHVAIRKHYTGTMVVGSTVLDTQEMQELIEGWGLLAKYPDILSKTMGCSPEIGWRIGDLTADPLPADNDGTNFILLTVTLNDSANRQQVENAVVNGIRNNIFVKQKTTIRMAALDELIKKTTAEIARLDSTRDLAGFLLSGQRQSNDRVIIDFSDLSKQKIDLEERLTGYRERKAFGYGSILVIGFAAIKGPKPGLLTLIGIGLLGGFLIGYLVATFKAFIRLTKQG